MNITHPDRLVFPHDNITKRDLFSFYESISDYILPYIVNRPLVLFRCMKSYDRSCFVHKHFKLPNEAVHILDIKEKTVKKPYVYIQDINGLLELIQMNTLEIHTWGCHIDNIEKPDLVIFDLDPSPDVLWKEVINGARLIKNELENMGLKSFVKTSGGKGLHIAVPIKPYLGWEDIKVFSGTFARYIELKNPLKYISTMNKEKRAGKIFIDYFRNNRGATTVAAYSVRARAHAPISTPLSWQELNPRIPSAHYTLKNLPRRLALLKRDPWEEFYTVQQALPFFENTAQVP